MVVEVEEQRDYLQNLALLKKHNRRCDESKLCTNKFH